MPDGSHQPSEGVWPGGCQYAAVLRTVEEEWPYCGRARVEELAEWARRDPRMAPFIALADPNKFVLVVEYSSCEREELTGMDGFAGEPVRAWIRGEEGLRVVGGEELGRLEAAGDARVETKGSAGYTLVTFYCYPNGADVLWSVVARPRVARGGRCAVDPKDPELGGVEWIS